MGACSCCGLCRDNEALADDDAPRGPLVARRDPTPGHAAAQQGDTIVLLAALEGDGTAPAGTTRAADRRSGGSSRVPAGQDRPGEATMLAAVAAEAPAAAAATTSTIINTPNGPGAGDEAVAPLQCAICNVDRWNPSLPAWHTALACIADRSIVDRIHRYMKGCASAADFPRHTHPDTKCFAMGRLMLQATIADAAAAAADEADGRCKAGRHHGATRAMGSSDPAGARIARTAEGKPYADHHNLLQQGWNINMSHGGSLVAVASGGCGGIVGVDVMPVELVPPPPEQPVDPAAGGRLRVTAADMQDFTFYFQSYFTTAEWQWIRRALPDPHATTPATAAAAAAATIAAGMASAPYVQLRRFYVLWTLKEAYIKAIGIGLTFDLQRAEFTFVRKKDDGGGDGDGRVADVADADFFLRPAGSAGAPPAQSSASFSSFISLSIDGVSQDGRWRFASFSYVAGADAAAAAAASPSVVMDYVGAVALGPYEDANVSSFREVVRGAQTQPGWVVALEVVERLGADVVTAHVRHRQE